MTNIQLIGLESMKSSYETNIDFGNAWKEIWESWSVIRTPYLDYLTKEGYLFIGHQLRIPIGPVKENLIK